MGRVQQVMGDLFLRHGSQYEIRQLHDMPLHDIVRPVSQGRNQCDDLFVTYHLKKNVSLRRSSPRARRPRSWWVASVDCRGAFRHGGKNLPQGRERWHAGACRRHRLWHGSCVRSPGQMKRGGLCSPPLWLNVLSCLLRQQPDQFRRRRRRASAPIAPRRAAEGSGMGAPPTSLNPSLPVGLSIAVPALANGLIEANVAVAKVVDVA